MKIVTCIDNQHTRGRVHQFEWNIGDQLATQGAAVQLGSNRVRDHDTQSFSWALSLGD